MRRAGQGFIAFSANKPAETHGDSRCRLTSGSTWSSTRLLLATQATSLPVAAVRSLVLDKTATIPIRITRQSAGSSTGHRANIPGCCFCMTGQLVRRIWPQAQRILVTSRARAIWKDPSVHRFLTFRVPRARYGSPRPDGRPVVSWLTLQGQADRRTSRPSTHSSSDSLV